MKVKKLNIKEKDFKLRLTAEDALRLENYAIHKDVSKAKVLRDYIRKLPLHEYIKNEII